MQIPKDAKIYVAGHQGLVGSAIMRLLYCQGFTKVTGRSHPELPLERQNQVGEFFENHRFDYVFLCAAKVGGILANSRYPADFILKNLAIQSHVISAAFKYGVKKLVFLGSSCIYPKECSQPIREDSLMTGELEETNSAYAMAKLAGIKMCHAVFEQYKRPFISLMPSSLYGINDHYDLENCHVLPAFIRRFHDAKRLHQKCVKLWGDGTHLREFLFSDDLAEAALFCLENYEENKILNVGSGSEIQIRDLAEKVRKIVGYEGDLVWDLSMPGGVKRKLLDSSRINQLGWKPRTSLEDGIRKTYEDYLTRTQSRTDSERV